jgi:hypothetical protein
MAFGAGMSMFGGFLQAKGAMDVAHDEAAMEEYNAQLALQEAKLTRQNTAEGQRLQRIEMRKTLATNRSITAGSGMMMKGTPAADQLDVIDDWAYEIARTGQEGEIQAGRLESQANIFRMRAKLARKRGRIQKKSAMFQGMGGGANSLNMSQQYS